jgi:hypothetical protein
VCCSCAEVSVQLLPLTSQETGRDLGLDAFATLADGTRVETPATLTQRSVICKLLSAASAVGRRAARAAATQCSSSPRCSSTCGASGRTVTTRRRGICCAPTTPSSYEALQCAKLSRRPAPCTRWQWR